jgi:hypothetical protein
MQLKGHVHYNSMLDKFDLVFWVEDAGQIVTANLGLLNWQIYTIEGQALANPDATGANVAANSSAVYAVTEISSPTFISNGQSYLVFVSTEVDGTPLSTFIPFIITNI